MAQKKQYKKTDRSFENKRDQKVPQVLPDKTQHKIHRLPFYFLFGFACLLYVNSLFNQYALDDRLMITENQFTKKGFDGIGDILSADSFVGYLGGQKNSLAGGRYRPLSHLTFAMEYEFVGFNPFIGHLINVLLYAFSCLIIYKVLKMLFPPGNKPFYLSIPFIATALFIAHPLHTEVVANIKGRDEIMSLLGSFAALFFSLKYIEKGRIHYLIWGVLSLFLGLMSKENAITFIAIIPLTLYFFTKTELKKNFIVTAFMFLAAVAFIFVRYKALGFIMSSNVETELLNNPFLNATPVQKYATILLTWGKYLLLILFPHPLTYDYYPKQIPIIGFSDIRALLPLFLYCTMIIFAFLKFKEKNIYSYCILFFGITFSISSNLFFIIGTFMNDRFMFFPLLGFCLIIAYLLTDKITNRFGENVSRKAVFMVVGVLLLAYSVKTISRNPAWYDDYTLFTTDVKTSYNSAKCLTSAGEVMLERSQEKGTDSVEKKQLLKQALEYLQRATQIHPAYNAAWILYGNAFLYLEQYEQAMQCYENSLRLTPGYKDAINNILCVAQGAGRKKQFANSVRYYKRLLVLQPNNYDGMIQLADVYEQANKPDSALAILNGIIKLKPDYYLAYNKMGEVYGKVFNNIDKSLEYLMKAYSMKQDDATVLENLGVAYGISADYKNSLLYFSLAYQQDSTNARLCSNIAKTYEMLSNVEKANEYYLKANNFAQKK
ncbi:MAG: tetratricopeptide repeat protein [Bacteroidales bacterium]